VAALRAAQARLHSAGITAWQDAMVGDSDLGPDPSGAYARLVASGDLSGRVVQGLWWDRERGLEQIDELVERREAVRDLPGISANVVKVMQDGMVENLTAAMLSPYVGPGASAGTGPSFIEPWLLSAATIELERRGFDVHFHAVGDRAVRECLDAVSAARAANGPTALRHQIAHLDVVSPADVGRFASLGVIANVQMLWARRDEEIVKRKLPLLGSDREASHFPFASLHAAGARLAAGSDWPVSAPDPLLAVHTAVHRTAPAQDVHAIGADVLTAPLEPSQALGLGTALEAFLSGAAYANRLETSTGALRVGLDADLVVLDSSLEAAAAPEGPGIGSVGVSATLVRGQAVHGAV
jgi:predicted amidohydrolase YtcJ